MFNDNIAPVGVGTPQIKLPKIEGITKIELFEEGKKVHEQTDKNMVTNAIKHFLSDLPQCFWWDGGEGFSIKTMLNKAFLPLYSKALGGLFLFENTNSENADKLYPDFFTNPPKFYAGGEYAGSDPDRGNYNTNESGAIEGGWRHVWDFGTDKANGNISSVSLTNVAAGDAPYGATLEWGGGNAGYLSMSTPLYIDENEFFVIRGPIRIDNNNYKLERIDPMNPQKITLTDSVTQYKITDIALSHWENSFTVCYIVGTVAYGAKYVSYSGKNLSFDFFTCDILTGIVSEPSRKIFTAPDWAYNGGVGGWRYYAGVFYAIHSIVGDTSNNKICAYSVDSASILNADIPLEGYTGSTKQALSGSQAGFFKVGDYYATHNSYNGTFLFSSTKIKYISTSGFSNNYNNSYIPFQGFMTNRHVSGTSSTYGAILPNYLATINNLSSPVTKTPSQSMKVTYEITNVE